jgi:predicted dehydrogenase
MHSILIIGCGSIGERHLRCFQATGRAKVTACDTNAALVATLAKTYQVATSTAWQQALADSKFDAVIICTPANLHVQLATQILQKGYPVLIEKPLSHSLHGVSDLIRARDTSGKCASVAYVLHVYPLLTAAREFLQSGELGAVRHATFTGGQNFPALRPTHAAHYSRTYYRDRKTGGGAIQDALTHTANWVESVIGPTDSVLCDCAHQVLADVSVEDTVNLSARHGDILVNYTLNQFQAPNESTLQFNTAMGSLKIEVHHQRWGVFRQGEKNWTWHEVSQVDRDTPFIEQANQFLDQIEGKPASLCSLEAALQTLRFNLSALASAESGARVSCASPLLSPA